MESRPSESVIKQLEGQLAMLEDHRSNEATACVTFGLPPTSFAEGVARLRQEAADAAKIRSRV